MKKRSRSRRPKRKGPRHRGQRRQKLSKTARELYPSGAADAGETAAEGWEEVLEQATRPPPPRRLGRRPPAGSGAREPVAGGPSPDRRGPPPGAAAPRRGWVVAPSSGACRIESEGRILDCVLPSEVARDQQQRLAVGDEVLFASPGDDAREAGTPDGGAPDGGGPFRLFEVLPRRTSLSRPDPRNPRRQRVIAANVDVVVQVVSLRRPPLRTALIDRCLIAVERGGAAGLICVNKVDLVRGGENRRRELAPLEPYRDLGLEVVICSALTGEGVDAIRRHLAGRTAVFVGHSGVGKSSLLNALDPDLDIHTRTVSGFGRGRHTTTRSRLYNLEGGIRVIDTPGIREFGLFELEAAELPLYFPEFLPQAGACRFNDCRHREEPDCAVRAAVAGGEIRPARYETYLRILDSL